VLFSVASSANVSTLDLAIFLLQYIAGVSIIVHIDPTRSEGLDNADRELPWFWSQDATTSVLTAGSGCSMTVGARRELRRWFNIPPSGGLGGAITYLFYLL
jgi:hypothetical protein